MNAYAEDPLAESSLSDDFQSKPSEDSDIAIRPEFCLKRGERYGWWHDLEQEENRKIALVHGAVNNFRFWGICEHGEFGLKLKLKFDKQISVSGLGGVPTSITANAEVKITLGPRVTYVVNVWVANIGGNIDILLGMTFMFSVGVRLCVKEGLVQLPGEETVLLSGRGLSDVKHVPDDPTARVPNVNAVVDRMDWKMKSVGCMLGKVINISNRIVTIAWRIEVAQVDENWFFPRAGRYVRVGTRRYRERQTLIYKILYPRKPRLESHNAWTTFRDGTTGRLNAELPVANLDDGSSTAWLRGSESDQISDSPSEVYDETIELHGITEVPISESEEVPDDQDSDEDEFCDSISVDDGFPDVHLGDIPKMEPKDDVFSDLPVSVMACTPVQQLELEYERAMRISAEELDLEPAVYIHEGSETLSQLREQLALLPDIEELSPKCDIDSADVGEPETSTPEDKRKLRAILKYH
ncbi:hypothetical protein PHMEG_0005844 [Phytophthora megakarya]|uniref:Eukaryotic/viral aspartic protease n=1 Tax=Phytophthora megakarya TaxID=4795 RepID=A0A225WSA9_9STRA|nr:hypothetical protein PHMEG_0005844 [Phytophthora megakarya]